jgi:uncharacterized membrane protein
MNISRLDAHHKLYISLCITAIAFGVSAAFGAGTSLKLMTTWLAYAFSSLALAWITILSSHPSQVKQEAHAQDSNRTLVFLFAITAAFASLFAIIILLQGNPDRSQQNTLMHIVIPLLCVVSSWWMVHTVFTLRYAHFYYCDIDHEKKGKKEKPGGLIFPGDREPAYMDFVYFSFVIGMTFQVSDVQITSKRIRRLAWMHGVLSFAFNTFIVALSINIIAGLIQK